MARKMVNYSVVDAFTDSPFKGNPAAVCFVEEERDEEWLKSVAGEFNISQTCYLFPISDSHSQPSLTSRFRLRWFTPIAEVSLCGHGTLAAAYTLFTSGLITSNTIEFLMQSGILIAKKVVEHGDSESLKSSENVESVEQFLVELNFPVVPICECESNEISSIHEVLNGASVIDTKKTTAGDIIVVLSSATLVVDFKPQIDEIRKCPGRGLILTAAAPPASGYDFFSRFFCPKMGINEDPVCGSAHCSLAPYWSKKLGKLDFVAHMASSRGGRLYVHLDDENQRILLRGKAVTVMKGSILV